MKVQEEKVLDVEALPFDQYQRYRLVADLLGELRDGTPLRVLDVGGRTALLRAFLPEDRVELVDVEVSGVEGLVLGDGSALPFRDGAFDAVCAFDTLEHVPPGGRKAFVEECARVAGRWVVLAGPYEHPRVDEAEERLVDFLEHKLGLRHRYLAEHRSNGLPDRAATVEGLEQAGARVACFGHGDLARWLALMCMELYLDSDPMLRPISKRFFRFYNRTMFESDHGPEVYRHAVVAAFDGAALPEGASFDAPQAAPAGATEALTTLAAELLAFDRERDAFAPELERLREVIGGLEADLTGHKARLADRSADLEAHEATLGELRATYEATLAEQEQERAVLQADLEQHARTIAEQERELAEARDAQAEERATLEADLAEHAQALADQARELEEVRGAQAEAASAAQAQREQLEQEVDDHRAVIATLEADLAEHAQALADQARELEEVRGAQAEAASAAQVQREQLEQEVDDHRSVIATLEADLSAHRATVADLQATLEAALSAREEQARAAAEQDAKRVADLGALREHQEFLEGELAQTHQSAQAIQQELLAAKRDIDALVTEVGGLRSDLRDRLGNLKRVFGRKPTFED